MSVQDDIAFLARSENRVETLETLVTGASTRSDVMDATGISRSTARRILADLVDRGWATSTDRGYVATWAGRLVAIGFQQTSETFGSAADLSAILEWLPWDEVGLDPGALGGARITRATTDDPFAPLTRLNAISRRAGHALTLTPVIDPQAFDITRERVRAGELRTQMIVEREIWLAILDGVPEEERPVDLPDDGLDLYLYDGSVPVPLTIVDGTVVVGVTEDDLVPVALVESDDEAVVEWARETFATYRDRSESLDADALVD